MKVYKTSDGVYRVEVTPTRVRVYRYGSLVKDARSIPEAVDWLRGEGVDELVED